MNISVFNKRQRRLFSTQQKPVSILQMFDFTALGSGLHVCRRLVKRFIHNFFHSPDRLHPLVKKLSREVCAPVLKIRRDDAENNSKSVQENKTTDLQPCLWCTRRTTLKCSKCQWAYCSRRCAFSDPLHNSYDTCSYENFCALCVDTKGYCNIHKSPDKAQAENE